MVEIVNFEPDGEKANTVFEVDPLAEEVLEQFGMGFDGLNFFNEYSAEGETQRVNYWDPEELDRIAFVKIDAEVPEGKEVMPETVESLIFNIKYKDGTERNYRRENWGSSIEEIDIEHNEQKS